MVDDHPVVREGLVAMLETQPDFEIVGEAGSGAEGLSVIAEFSPDVVLLDLELPGVDGVGVLRRLRELKTTSRVIVFTVFDTDDRIISAVEAGAAGYLLKGALGRTCSPPSAPSTLAVRCSNRWSHRRCCVTWLASIGPTSAQRLH